MLRMIRGGTVIDGTGAPPAQTDVLIRDGAIAAVGPGLAEQAAGAEVIPAESLTVTPGFIDMHRHADIAPLTNPRFGEIELTQGITATVTGNCGIACVPVRGESAEAYRRFVTPIIGEAPEGALFPDYRAYRRMLGQAALPLHMGFLAGTGAVKVAVKGFSPSPYTPREMAEAQALVREAMEQGALGVSLGFMYQPECYTTPEEQAQVIRPAAEAGGILTTHIRGEGNSLVQSVLEVIRVAEMAGIQLHISHFKATGIKNWGKAIHEAIQAIEDARARGLPVTADFYPYDCGSTTIFSLIPPAVLRDDNEQTMAWLETPAGREQLRREIAREDPDWDNMALSIGFDRIAIAGVSLPEHAAMSGRVVSELAEEAGMHPSDFLAELLCSERGQVGITVMSMDPADVETVARLPWTCLISDGLYGPGDCPHPRLYGAFPHFLRHFVWERLLLPLPEAIRKMTSMPASLLKLEGRGILRPGAAADLCLFDPETLTDRADYAHGRWLSAGMRRVLVGGRDALIDEQMTSARAGCVLTH